MKSVPVLLLLCTLTASTAEPFSTKIDKHPQSVLPGTMIRIDAEAANASGKPVHVANVNPGFVFNIEIRRADDKPVNPRCIYPEDAGLIVIPSDPTPVPADWRENTHLECQIWEEPGVWIVRSYIKSKGEQRGARGKKLADRKYWQGVVYSEPIEIEILAPQGIDRDAYEEFYLHSKFKSQNVWREQLLAKYPTSTYAGYALGRGGLITMATNPDKFEENFSVLTSGHFFRDVPTALDPFDPNRPRINREAAVKAEIAQLENFLSVHPDFVQRDLLQFHLAGLYLVTGRYLDAYEAFDWHAKNSHNLETVCYSKKALSTLVSKGFISASVNSSAPK